MKNIDNIKRLPSEVAQLIAQNDKINRLLTIDTTTPLSDEVELMGLNDLITKKYVNFFIPTESVISDCNRNTMVDIALDDVAFSRSDNNSGGNLAIYVITDVGHLMLENKKNRILEICNEIMKTVDGAKLSSAGKISVTSMMAMSVGEFFNCYRLNVTFTDQANERAEI